MAGLSVLQKKAVQATGTLEVTSSAARAIQKYLKDHGAAEGSGLRVGVRGGGCSGLQYFLEVEEAPRESDRVIDKDGVTVFVDPKSLVFLQGATLDYASGLIESGFKFINPRASRGCGCGESFTPA
ncbi:MAG: iron-sulfur cluster assembly accessory protein [Myxococcales bacterium]|nr:iron-sulfur cluster assembly accessory protein [Myxococcales bacterium]